MENLRLIVFILIVSLVFPIFGMALTQGESEVELYDVSVSPESLVSAGILLREGESHNVSYGGGYVYFTLNDTEVRVKWDNMYISGYRGIYVKADYVKVEKKSPLGRIMNSWLFSETLYVVGMKTGYKTENIYNNTIIEEWNQKYNWSMFKIPGEGLIMLIQYPPTSENITDAVYNDGMITITIGSAVDLNESINFRRIINWYTGLIIGDQTFGLPSFFTWIVRIITALGVLAMAVFIKEMIRL